MREKLAQATQLPAGVVYCYAAFHAQRNTACGTWMKSLCTQSVADSLRVPYTENPVEIAEVQYRSGYKGLRLNRQSALVNLIDDWWNSQELNHEVEQQLMQAVVSQMELLCASYEVPFFILQLDESPVSFTTTAQIVQVDADYTNPYFNFHPLDLHPNARWHEAAALSAAELIMKLEELIRGDGSDSL
jgi:hypothetical protein